MCPMPLPPDSNLGGGGGGGGGQNGLQLEKLRLSFFFNDRGLFALCELRLYLPLDVQRKCYEWIKLATTNFQDSLGQNSAKSH